jgi:hypothetical protein
MGIAKNGSSVDETRRSNKPVTAYPYKDRFNSEVIVHVCNPEYIHRSSVLQLGKEG